MTMSNFDLLFSSDNSVVAPGFHYYWDLRKVVSLSPYLVVSLHPGYLTSTVLRAVWCGVLGRNAQRMREADTLRTFREDAEVATHARDQNMRVAVFPGLQ